MTENFHRTRFYEPDHSTFAGRIYESDFNGYVSLSDIAKRIERDRRFDMFCCKSDKERKRKQKCEERIEVKNNGE